MKKHKHTQTQPKPCILNTSGNPLIFSWGVVDGKGEGWLLVGYLQSHGNIHEQECDWWRQYDSYLLNILSAWS